MQSKFDLRLYVVHAGSQGFIEPVHESVHMGRLAFQASR